MADPKLAKPTKPLFDIARQGVGGRVAHDHYFEADHSASCEKCSSAAVIELTSKGGRKYLSEIWELSDETAVYSPSDFHSNYCTPPSQSALNRRETQRIHGDRLALIKAAFQNIGGNKPTPEPDETPEPETPKVKRTPSPATPEPDPEIPETPKEPEGREYPFHCHTCGFLIYHTPGRLIMNHEDNQPHTCKSFHGRDELDKARALASRSATRVKFAEISKRMDAAEATMRDDSLNATMRASSAAEYLMLRKRLWTEIP